MIISTTNFGNTWEYDFSVLPINTINFYFLNKNFGWATTDYINFKTTDGGQTWENMGNQLESANWDIFFDDTLNGWSVGGGCIKSTTDGGYSWNTSTVVANQQLNFISRYDDSTLFTGGSELFKTTDNGQSWNFIQTPTNFYSSGFVAGRNNDNIFGFLSGRILGGAAAIFKTTDAGVSWNCVFYDTSSSSFRNIAISKDLLIAYSMKKVFRSTDFGESWDSTIIPLDDYLSPINIYFATDEIIYLSGEFGNFARSTDGGKSFEVLSHNNLYENINDFSFGDSLNGYFTTWNPKIYKTSNAGESFIDITPNDFLFPFYKIHAVSNNMVVTNAGGNIYITKDGGLSWNVSSYNSQYPSVIYFFDTLNGWISYLPNLIRRTTDGGETWSDVFLNDGLISVNSLSFVDELNGFFSTGSRLYNTTNGGQNWNLVSNFGIYDIEFLDRDKGVGIKNSYLYSTSDGGSSWDTLDTFGYIHEMELEKTATGSVLILLNGYFLYTSFDLGQTWKIERVPVNELHFLSISDSRTAWISSYTGRLIKYYIPSNPSSVNSDNEKNINYQLLQNYPNPFNPLTSILYKIPEEGNVTLIVFDILGREIKTLIDENKIAGEYKIEFDASSLPSGVYIYKIQVNDYISAKKMVLLK